MAGNFSFAAPPQPAFNPALFAQHARELEHAQTQLVPEDDSSDFYELLGNPATTTQQSQPYSFGNMSPDPFNYGASISFGTYGRFGSGSEFPTQAATPMHPNSGPQALHVPPNASIPNRSYDSGGGHQHDNENSMQQNAPSQDLPSPLDAAMETEDMSTIVMCKLFENLSQMSQQISNIKGSSSKERLSAMPRGVGMMPLPSAKSWRDWLS
jgi:hypothetical protein